MYQPFSSSTLKESCCVYCTSPTQITCGVCNHSFCNSRGSASASHIIFHLVKNKHRVVLINGEQVSCFLCNSLVIFNLGYSYLPDSGSEDMSILCRSCGDSSSWRPLIVERCLVQSLVGERSIPPSKLSINATESVYAEDKLNSNGTLFDSQNNVINKRSLYAEDKLNSNGTLFDSQNNVINKRSLYAEDKVSSNGTLFETQNNVINKSSFYSKTDKVSSNGSLFETQNNVISKSSFYSKTDKVSSNGSFFETQNNVINKSSFYSKTDNLTKLDLVNIETPEKTPLPHTLMEYDIDEYISIYSALVEAECDAEKLFKESLKEKDVKVRFECNCPSCFDKPVQKSVSLNTYDMKNSLLVQENKSNASLSFFDKKNSVIVQETKNSSFNFPVTGISKMVDKKNSILKKENENSNIGLADNKIGFKCSKNEIGSKIKSNIFGIKNDSNGGQKCIFNIKEETKTQNNAFSIKKENNSQNNSLSIKKENNTKDNVYGIKEENKTQNDLFDLRKNNNNKDNDDVKKNHFNKKLIYKNSYSNISVYFHVKDVDTKLSVGDDLLLENSLYIIQACILNNTAISDELKASIYKIYEKGNNKYHKKRRISRDTCIMDKYNLLLPDLYTVEYVYKDVGRSRMLNSLNRLSNVDSTILKFILGKPINHNIGDKKYFLGEESHNKTFISNNSNVVGIEKSNKRNGMINNNQYKNINDKTNIGNIYNNDCRIGDTTSNNYKNINDKTNNGNIYNNDCRINDTTSNKYKNVNDKTNNGNIYNNDCRIDDTTSNNYKNINDKTNNGNIYNNDCRIDDTTSNKYKNVNDKTNNGNIYNNDCRINDATSNNYKNINDKTNIGNIYNNDCRIDDTTSNNYKNINDKTNIGNIYNNDCRINDTTSNNYKNVNDKTNNVNIYNNDSTPNNYNNYYKNISDKKNMCKVFENNSKSNQYNSFKNIKYNCIDNNKRDSNKTESNNINNHYDIEKSRNKNFNLNNEFNDADSLNGVISHVDKLFNDVVLLHPPNLPTLNSSQQLAAKAALSQPLTLIQGPPGTGKTVTCAAIIYNLVKSEINIKNKVLVVANSNTAVDHLAKKIHKTGLKVVRLVSKRRENQQDELSFLSVHVQAETLMKMIKDSNEPGAGNRNDHLLVKKMNLQGITCKSTMKKRIINYILDKAEVITCTCIMSGDSVLSRFIFNTVIIDEAVQCTEPVSLVPIVNSGCSRLVLVGDHKQLGPIVVGKDVSKAGMKMTLFERIVLNCTQTTTKTKKNNDAEKDKIYGLGQENKINSDSYFNYFNNLDSSKKDNNESENYNSAYQNNVIGSKIENNQYNYMNSNNNVNELKNDTINRQFNNINDNNKKNKEIKKDIMNRKYNNINVNSNKNNEPKNDSINRHFNNMNDKNSISVMNNNIEDFKNLNIDDKSNEYFKTVGKTNQNNNIKYDIFQDDTNKFNSKNSNIYSSELNKNGLMPYLLNTQYRMHPSLSSWINSYFYDGSLINGKSCKSLLIPESLSILPLPTFFYCCYGQEEISQSGTSFLNRTEAKIVEEMVKILIQGGVKEECIGVVTPYEGQRAYLVGEMTKINLKIAHKIKDKKENKTLIDYENRKINIEKLEIKNIDAFQGREKEYIIISLVRSNSYQGIGFVSDGRRLNVTLTRARYGTIIVGNPITLGKNKMWNDLLTNYQERGLIYGGCIGNMGKVTVIKKNKGINLGALFDALDN